MSHLFSTLSAAGQLRYPISLLWGDKPDFVLVMDGDRIGIEVTEAIPASYAHYSAIASREYPGAIQEPALFRYGQESLTPTEMRSFLSSGKLQSSGWTGSECEEDWSHWVNDLIAAKLDCLGNEEFETHPKNWLAIYDNLPPIGVNLSRALPVVVHGLDAPWLRDPSFDVVFVLMDQVLVRIARRGWDLLPVVEL